VSVSSSSDSALEQSQHKSNCTSHNSDDVSSPSEADAVDEDIPSLVDDDQAIPQAASDTESADGTSENKSQSPDDQDSSDGESARAPSRCPPIHSMSSLLRQ